MTISRLGERWKSPARWKPSLRKSWRSAGSKTDAPCEAPNGWSSHRLTPTCRLAPRTWTSLTWNSRTLGHTHVWRLWKEVAYQISALMSTSPAVRVRRHSRILVLRLYNQGMALLDSWEKEADMQSTSCHGDIQAGPRSGAESLWLKDRNQVSGHALSQEHVKVQFAQICLLLLSEKLLLLKRDFGLYFGLSGIRSHEKIAGRKLQGEVGGCYVNQAESIQLLSSNSECQQRKELSFFLKITHCLVVNHAIPNREKV